jgi:hypothetical protein
MLGRLIVCLVVLAVAIPGGLHGQGTAFKTGEQTTGMTKQCYYNYLGSGYTYTTSAVTLCPLSVSVPAPASSYNPQSHATPPAPPVGGGTAFKTGERTTGMTKQCYYNYLGSGYTKTVSSVELCPLSVTVE